MSTILFMLEERMIKEFIRVERSPYFAADIYVIRLARTLLIPCCGRDRLVGARYVIRHARDMPSSVPADMLSVMLAICHTSCACGYVIVMPAEESCRRPWPFKVRAPLLRLSMFPCGGSCRASLKAMIYYPSLRLWRGLKI
ncbi:hypothetical protein Tco_0172794 [Tanacetum coccineum]